MSVNMGTGTAWILAAVLAGGCSEGPLASGDTGMNLDGGPDAPFDAMFDANIDARTVNAPLVEVTVTPEWPAAESCGAVTMPTAAICGGMDRCVVTVDEVLPGGPQPGNALQIAIADGEPHVLYSHNLGGFFAWHGQRSASGWSTAELPMALARGRLLSAPGQEVQLLAYDGAFGLSRWHLSDAEGWVADDRFVGLLVPGAALDDAGCIHLVAQMDDEREWPSVVYGRYAGEAGWSFTRVTDNSGQSRLVMGSDGTPHVFYSEPTGGAWQTRHAQPGLREDAFIAASNIWTASESDADMIFHSLVQEPWGYERYVGDRLENTALELIEEGETCEGTPFGNGETCTVDSTAYWGLDIAASGDSPAAILMARRHDTGEVEAFCTDGGGIPPMCNWPLTGIARDGQLILAWVEDGVPQQRVLLDAVIGSATATVDNDGALHILVAVAPNGSDRDANQFSMRYLRLEAPAL